MLVDDFTERRCVRPALRQSINRLAHSRSVQGKRAYQNLRELDPIILGEMADQAPIQRTQPAVGGGEQISGMRIGVEDGL